MLVLDNTNNTNDDDNNNNKNNPNNNSRKENRKRKENNEGPRENENVKRFIKDPSQLPTDTTVLYGYVGSSVSAEITRLYTDTSFKEYYEINKNDIKDWKENTQEKDPFGGTFIFVDSDAEIKVVRIEVAKVRARFLAGVISKYLRPEGRRRLRRRIGEGRRFYTAPSVCTGCGYQYDVEPTELHTRCPTCGDTCGESCPVCIKRTWYITCEGKFTCEGGGGSCGDTCDFTCGTCWDTCKDTCYYTCGDTCRGFTCENC